MWSPRGFADFEDLFPETPPLDVPNARPTVAFAQAWEGWDEAELDRRLKARADGVRVAFVRGWMGGFMPGNLEAPVRALRRLGIRARVVADATGGTIDDNAARIADELDGDHRPLLLCGHSRGGLQCLRLVDRHRKVGDHVIGVILCQAPRGPSAALESLLAFAHRGSLAGAGELGTEAIQRALLFALGASRGGRELTGGGLGRLLAQLDGQDRLVPIWQVATWAETPSSWVGPTFARQARIRPGQAQDGLFYLPDLVWPGLPHLLLPRVDHAQPALGSGGFDHVRFWKVLIAVFLAGRGGV